MKVQLIVVRGKPEGKVIPLAGPKFKIGRGEGCHLRPNSDQVSREHAEFIVLEGVVTVQDLKSRNGTQVNGKTIAGPAQLKDRDLVQVGPLTFAVSIQGAPAAAAVAKPAAPAQAKPAAAAAPGQPPSSKPAAAAAAQRSAPEEVLNEDIDSWLVGAPSESSTEIPTSVYGGETVTISTYQGNSETPPASASAEEEDEDEDEDDDELEEEEEEEEEDEEDEDGDEEDEDEDEDGDNAPPVDEFIDESNPFYAAKKAQQQGAKTPAGAGGDSANQQFQDTSGAASEILKKLMERRRASR